VAHLFLIVRHNLIRNMAQITGISTDEGVYEKVRKIIIFDITTIDNLLEYVDGLVIGIRANNMSNYESIKAITNRLVNMCNHI